jgi:AAHS family 4-hydroxybenzoate transporter-like MFS transporter
MTFYLGLALVTSFGLMMVVAIVAGLGIGFTMPAMSAFYLDITSEQHRSRVMGIKESAVAMGGVAGPLLVIAVSALTTPQGVFIVAAVMLGLTALLAVFALREPQRAIEKPDDLVLETTHQRALAAQATLRGVVMHARLVRGERDRV